MRLRPGLVTLAAFLLACLALVLPAGASTPDPQGSGMTCGFALYNEGVLVSCHIRGGAGTTQDVSCGSYCDLTSLETHCWYHDGPGPTYYDCPLLHG